jgi:hypothetical protein
MWHGKNPEGFVKEIITNCLALNLFLQYHAANLRLLLDNMPHLS